MVYFFLFVLLLVITIFLIVVKHERLTKKNKILIFSLATLVIFLIVAYQYSFNERSNINRDKINHFNQGKNLSCKGYVVDSDNFSFFGGTNSFVAKDRNKSLNGVIINLKDCEIE